LRWNEGNLDPAQRVIAGLALVGLTASGQIGLWGYVGVVTLLTGAMGMNPVSTLLGNNTCPARR